MLRRETDGAPERLAAALDGLRRYQEAPRAPASAPPAAAVAERMGAAIRDYGGSGPAVLFVPSLINPPTILDLSAERSLLRWLAGTGAVRPLLLDWGWPGAARRGLGVAGHVEQILLPLIEALGEVPPLVGYCLGGTMALAAARALDAPVATIAAPWCFAGFPDEARTMLAGLWAGAAPTAEQLGVLPMEILQSAFWSLDPGRTVAKFEAFAAMPPESGAAAAFVTLEDWANDGPPLPLAAGRELFEDMFGGDVTGRGEWVVAGRRVDPSALRRPVLEIVSTTDRIVPAASAAGAGARLSLAQGHVGMIIGGSARERLWEPLAAWLSRTAANC